MNHKIFVTLSMLIVLGAILSIGFFLNMDTDLERDTSVSSYESQIGNLPRLFLKSTVESVEPATDFSLEVIPVMPTNLQGNPTMNVSEVVIEYPVASFSVMDVEPINDTTILNKQIDNERGVVSFDITRKAPFGDSNPIARIYARSNDDASSNSEAAFRVNPELSTYGLPNQLDSYNSLTRVGVNDLTMDRNMLYGESCTKSTDCKLSTIPDAPEPACIEGICKNPSCPSFTNYGTRGDCNNSDQTCGQRCGFAYGLCEEGYSCRFASDNACSSSSGFCVPYGINANRRGKIENVSYLGQDVVLSVCGGAEQGNSYIQAIADPTKEWSQDDVLNICDQFLNPPVEPTCLLEGETGIGQNISCCEGLQPRPRLPEITEGLRFTPPPNYSEVGTYFCTDCGDGICSSFENSSTCPQDCPRMDDINPVPPVSYPRIGACITVLPQCPTGQTATPTGSNNFGCTVYSCVEQLECTPLPACYYGINIGAGNEFKCDISDLPQDTNWCSPVDQSSDNEQNACNIDINNDGLVDSIDLVFFAQNYKKGVLSDCSRDMVGGDCQLTIADLQLFGKVYKQNDVCSGIPVLPPMGSNTPVYAEVFLRVTDINQFYNDTLGTFGEVRDPEEMNRLNTLITQLSNENRMVVERFLQTNNDKIKQFSIRNNMTGHLVIESTADFVNTIRQSNNVSNVIILSSNPFGQAYDARIFGDPLSKPINTSPVAPQLPPPHLR